MMWPMIATFAVALIPIVVTPGTSAILTTQYVTLGGRRHGAAVMAGTTTGHYIHATFAAVGLSTLVMASATAFAVVRYVGAAYLLGLGIYLLVSSRFAPTDKPVRGPLPSMRQIYGQAVAGNVFNPKAALVYLTLPAQVVGSGHSIVVAAFVLATVHSIMMTSWLTMWTQILNTATQRFSIRRMTRGISRAGGLLLIALGIRTALSSH